MSSTCLTARSSVHFYGRFQGDVFAHVRERACVQFKHGRRCERALQLRERLLKHCLLRSFISNSVCVNYQCFHIQVWVMSLMITLYDDKSRFECLGDREHIYVPLVAVDDVDADGSLNSTFSDVGASRQHRHQYSFLPSSKSF